MTTTERIPIWLYDKKLWINDADRRTTCADVVTTLTGGRGSDYAVTVDDRGARPGTAMVADPGVRVLKIWQSLRPDQKMCLQKVNGSEDGGRGVYAAHRENDDDGASEMSGYRAQRKRRREVVKYASRTMHPKRLSDTQAAEELLKLILEQSDTIRAQLKKLQDRDKKIEKIETETHRTRADALGTNYLLDAYMGGGNGGGGDEDDGGCSSRNGGCSSSGGGGCGDDKEEKDSGITEGGASVENDDDDGSGEIADEGAASAIAYLERIVKINKKLYEHEERLIRLYVNIERCRDQDQLLDELKRAEDELAETERMYRENKLLIRNTDTELYARLGYIEQLQYEAAIVDSENEYMMDFIEHDRQQQQQNLVDTHHHNHTAANRVLDTLV